MCLVLGLPRRADKVTQRRLWVFDQFQIGWCLAAYRPANGCAVSPWSTTLSRTVKLIVATTSSSGPSTPWRSSRAIRAKTIEANPRGPNQPMKNTVAQSIRAPSSEIATGSMRITVRLSPATHHGEGFGMIKGRAAPAVSVTRSCDPLSKSGSGRCRAPADHAQHAVIGVQDHSAVRVEGDWDPCGWPMSRFT